MLALAEIAWTIWRLGGRIEVLVLLSLAFLLALRALPHTPGHDGVRQFLPAMGCLALVASFGATRSINQFGAWGMEPAYYLGCAYR